MCSLLVVSSDGGEWSLVWSLSPGSEFPRVAWFSAQRGFVSLFELSNLSSMKSVPSDPVLSAHLDVSSESELMRV